MTVLVLTASAAVYAALLIALCSNNSVFRKAAVASLFAGGMVIAALNVLIPPSLYIPQHRALALASWLLLAPALFPATTVLAKLGTVAQLRLLTGLLTGGILLMSGQLAVVMTELPQYTRQVTTSLRPSTSFVLAGLASIGDLYLDNIK